jgi:hypothetical protein
MATVSKIREGEKIITDEPVLQPNVSIRHERKPSHPRIPPVVPPSVIIG